MRVSSQDNEQSVLHMVEEYPFNVLGQSSIPKKKKGKKEENYEVAAIVLFFTLTT